MKFTVKDFHEKYPTDDACLDEIFHNRFDSLKNCPKCGKDTKFYRISDRKCWACPFCSYQLHPLAGTIFHKSETPLRSWFFAIFLFANSKNGVSAMELKRQLGVTYKTAWRMAKQIRLLFKSSGKPLSFLVEADETYIGGVTKGERGPTAGNKTVLFGMVQRKGDVKAQIVEDVKSDTLYPIMRKNLEPGTNVITDDNRVYASLPSVGYYHRHINHSLNQYVSGTTHTNTIEGFWSQLKRSIHGTYHHVSRKHLQAYVDEFCYRYNRRFDGALFPSLIQEVAKPV